MKLIPRPQKITKKPGVFRLGNVIRLSMDKFSQDCVAAFLSRTSCHAGSQGPLLHIIKEERGHSEESYRLHVLPEEIQVIAKTERGVIWALTTAAELLQGGVIPCCEIEDAPRYVHRGLSLDCARQFFPASEVKKVIEEMSLAKMNVLHWHLSDDQGWRIQSKRFSRLQEISGNYYTQEEIREIVSYAMSRGVEIIPEIDMPGHTSAILAAYSEYSCSGKTVTLAHSGGIYPIILCPGQDKTFDFLQGLLEEILPLFPGPRFHLGGDEAPKSEWKKCPHCTARMKDERLARPEELQGYFTARLCRLLAEHGKQPICWNETLLAANVPEDLQIQYWTLQHREPMEPFVQRGGQWIYSDMFELYLDYPYSMTSIKKLYHTAPHLGKQKLDGTLGLLGMEGCIWAEHIRDEERLERLLFPRLYALAEICWSGAGDYKDFLSRLATMISGPLHQMIRYTPRSWWDPKGAARREEALA